MHCSSGVNMIQMEKPFTGLKRYLLDGLQMRGLLRPAEQSRQILFSAFYLPCPNIFSSFGIGYSTHKASVK